MTSASASKKRKTNEQEQQLPSCESQDAKAHPNCAWTKLATRPTCLIHRRLPDVVVVQNRILLVYVTSAAEAGDDG